jgi:hypothetical protein
VNFSRRNFLMIGAAAGAYGIFSKISRAQADSGAEPHFLLSIHIQGGIDCTYLFDARIPKLTEKNLQQNYLFKNDDTTVGSATQPAEFTEDKLRARTMLCEATGAAALRSPLVDTLWENHKDRLSVVNGVYMLRSNAGHAENSAYLYGNTERGGSPIYPPVVGKHLEGAPLDAVILREFWQITPPPSNLAGSAELASREITALAQSLASGPQIDEASPTWKYILQRADVNSDEGLFGAGSQNLASGLRRAKATSAAFVATGGSAEPAPPAPVPGADPNPPLPQTVRRALAFFSGGVTKVATVVQDSFPTFDTHDRVASQTTQIPRYIKLAAELDEVMRLLKTTMHVDARGVARPFIDVTTFVISSEFGRTTRSLSFPARSSVGATGTDHNPLTNSAIVGGKGIVGGLIVGESDLRDCDDAGAYTEVSGAHRQKNASLNQVMGKPFDFKSQRVRSDLPDSWNETDYICMPSVTNTILDALGVPEADRFKLGSRAAPILKVLRTGGGR